MNASVSSELHLPYAFGYVLVVKRTGADTGGKTSQINSWQKLVNSIFIVDVLGLRLRLTRTSMKIAGGMQTVENHSK
jgi:hypothetical protein